MDNPEIPTLYSRYRDRGYTRIEALARCKAFRSQYRPLGQSRSPYNDSNMAESLHHESNSQFIFRTTDQATSPLHTYQTTERHTRHDHHLYDEHRRAGRNSSSNSNNSYYGSNKKAPDDDYADEDLSFREEYQSTRTSYFRTQSYSTIYTETKASQNSFYNVEMRAPRTPASGLQSRFPDSSPLPNKYFTEERMPRKPSPKTYQYPQHSETPPRPARTKSDRQSYRYQNAVPPPLSSRTHTDASRHNTTERKPRDMPRRQEYYRESSPFTPHETPRFHAHPKSHRTRTPSPQPPPPPPPTGYKPTLELYRVLGVSQAATPQEIKQAHRKLSMKWHPDRCTEANKEAATAAMAEINQANDVLSDMGKRRFYDRTGCIPGSLDIV